MGRRFLTAQVVVNGKELWINTVHLESLLNKEVRIRQLKSIFDEYMKGQTDSLFMGDFNFGDYTVENQHLSKEYVDCWKASVHLDETKDDGLDKYRKMVKILPKETMIHRLRQDEISGDIAQKFEESGVLPDGGIYAKMKEHKGGQTGFGQRYDKMLMKSERWGVAKFDIIGKPNMPSDHLGIVATLKLK